MKKLFKFLAKLWQYIADLFRELPAELQKAVAIGVVVTEGLKTIIDSPAADIITALIPGKADDEIKNWLRANLPSILASLRLANMSDIGKLTPEQIILKAAKAIADLDGDAKSAALHNIAIMITKARADGKITWSDGVYLLEWAYNQQQKEAA